MITPRIVLLISSFAIASPVGANLVSNGSFESGIDLGTFTNVPVGGTAIDDWEVVSGNVDYIGTFWISADGARSVDLSGNQAGAISQAFSTVVGTTYNVLFNFAGNPDGPLGDEVKSMRVSAEGVSAPFQDFNFDTTGNTRADLGWIEEGFVFIADSAMTLLTFQSLTGGRFGPAIDNVRVNAVPIPPAAFLFLSALIGLGWVGWRKQHA